MTTITIKTISCDGHAHIDVKCTKDAHYSYVGWCACGARWADDDREVVKEGVSTHLMVYTMLVKQGIIRDGLALWRS